MRSELGAGGGGQTNNPGSFCLANFIRSEIGREIESHEKLHLWINLLELGFVFQCLIRCGDGWCEIWLTTGTSGFWDMRGLRVEYHHDICETEPALSDMRSDELR
jgi:hypothetical protein